METKPYNPHEHRGLVKAAWIGALGAIVAALINVTPQVVNRIPAAPSVDRFSGRSDTIPTKAGAQPAPAPTEIIPIAITPAAPSVATRSTDTPSRPVPSLTASSTTSGSTLSTTSIQSIEQLEGQPGWVPSQRRFIAKSLWRFYPNRTFEFSSPGLRADLYPLVGKYELSGNTITFQAEYLVRSSHTSKAWTRMQGTMDLTGGMVTATWFTGAMGSGDAGGIPPNRNASSGYRFQVRVNREMP